MTVMEKLKAVKNTLSNIEKQFGKGTVFPMGESVCIGDYPSYSTGSIQLDAALGIGGLPRGRLIEIFGPESSGKTTMALHIIAEAQKKGGLCAFIDAEHALDISYARNLGVDDKSLLLSQPDCGEDALQIADMLLQSKNVDLVVIDSVAALVPRAELDGEMSDHHIGLQARMMSKAMRKLTGITHKTGSMIIFINQIRHKIGVSFGSPETTSGGNALKFHTSCRLDIRKIGQIKVGDEVIGNKTRVKVVKNKMAPPYKTAHFEIHYGMGVNRNMELLDIALEKGIITKAGSWFSMGDKQIGQGRQNAAMYFDKNPKDAENILKKLTVKKPENEKKPDGKAA